LEFKHIQDLIQMLTALRARDKNAPYKVQFEFNLPEE
jgi:hypothetical protein